MYSVSKEFNIWQLEEGEAVALSQKDINIGSGENNEEALESLIAFYDEDEDKLYFGINITERQKQFVMKALKTDPEYALKRLGFHHSKELSLPGNRQLVMVIALVIRNRTINKFKMLYDDVCAVYEENEKYK